MRLIDIFVENEVLDEDEIVEHYCPNHINELFTDGRFPAFDAETYAHDDNGLGCRGITCEQCWNMEEEEIIEFVHNFNQKRNESYEQESE